ncbi:class II aldolase/adducin family protein [Sphingobium indicum]|nr:class II aldolase/adducin family protein [Sphingobium indicum]NYI23929.1 ribulose-5-phosphate 4-epimerase/fuculose-1-phosphate aldolase [Sphingobium indicum]
MAEAGGVMASQPGEAPRGRPQDRPWNPPSRGIDQALRDGQRLRFEVPPDRADPAEERLHRKQRLAATFRLFARYNLSSGIAGHVTVRDPELTDHFWVNPQGVNFCHIRVSDLLLVDDGGRVVEGGGALNEAAYAIHAAIHRAHPGVNAAAHTHSFYGKAWSTTGRLLDPISQDACMFHDDHGLFDDYGGVVLDQTEGDRIAAALRGRKALILQNHGLLTAGRSIEATAFWYLALERAAHGQIVAEALGKPRIIPAEVAAQTARMVGSEAVAWMCFQPEWDMLVQQEPDFLL